MRDPNVTRPQNPVNGTDERFDHPYERGTDCRSLIPVQQQLFNPDAQQVIFRDGDYERPVELDLSHETVWMTQKELAEFFSVTVATISRHVSNILKEGIYRADSVVTQYVTHLPDGRSYEVEAYSLDVLIEIGYRVRRTPRAIRFRQFVVEAVFMPLGDVLRTICETVNLDRVTGARLYHIDAGKDGGK